MSRRRRLGQPNWGAIITVTVLVSIGAGLALDTLTRDGGHFKTSTSHEIAVGKSDVYIIKAFWDSDDISADVVGSLDISVTDTVTGRPIELLGERDEHCSEEMGSGESNAVLDKFRVDRPTKVVVRLRNPYGGEVSGVSFGVLAAGFLGNMLKMMGLAMLVLIPTVVLVAKLRTRMANRRPGETFEVDPSA